MSDNNSSNAPSENAGEKNRSMSIGKGILMTVIAIIFVAAVTLVLIKLNLCIWIVWLGMVCWCIGGMKADMRLIGKTWISAAAGVFLGFMLKSGQLGNTGLIIGFVCALLFIFGMVTHRFPLVCNNTTAVFLTACTADGLIMNAGQMALSVLIGFLIFGIVPWAAGRAKTGSGRKK